MRIRRRVSGFFALVICFSLIPACAVPELGEPGANIAENPDFVEWRTYLGDKASSQYAALSQINRQNVHQLEVAWTYHTGDMRERGRSEIQCNPIIVEAVLYCTSPQLKVIALHAETGEEVWQFDPLTVDDGRSFRVNRGLAYWEHNEDRRIFHVAGAWLYALDARTGRLIPAFGDNGRVDLRQGLGRDASDRLVTATTPGIVYRDLLILGSSLAEDMSAAPGDIRAFDVRTGEVAWIFHTIPHPGEFGYETWSRDSWLHNGGANNWAGMALDEQRGVVYVPTGSAAFDFWGGNRLGENLFANTILALDAATGERVWHYQVVRHDLWDWDLPAPPNLVRLRQGNRWVDAVAQITKFGHIFVLDRDTGTPLFPVEEVPVPPSDVVGEEAWPTQLIPTRPPPFARQHFSEEVVTNISPESRAFVLDSIRHLRYGRMFIPPSVEGTIVFPGFDGGGEWGGAAFDPTSGILYVNSNEMAWISRLIPKGEQQVVATSLGAASYAVNCAACHGAGREGDGLRNPSLLGLRERMTQEQARDIIESGRGFMPAFQKLPEQEKEAIVAYLLGTEATSGEEQKITVQNLEDGIPYRFAGYHRFLDPEGHPVVKPPWGTLNAIDLNRGELIWQVPLGELPELTARGIPPTGTENYGGPVVTAGGLIFIAATKDEMFRAIDKETGQVLWETKLPAGGYATPATYMVNGRQYVVIAAGGGKMGTKPGDAFVAFALPE